jgi:polysaccharide export outer membrane protein
MFNVKSIPTIAVALLLGSLAQTLWAQNLSPAELAALASAVPSAAGQGAMTEGALVSRPDTSVMTDQSQPPERDSMPVSPPLKRELFPGAEPLTPFGYDVFGGAAGVTAPSPSLPAPTDYVLAAGDTLEVLIISERGGRFVLPISRDGEINIPQIGPMPVAGQPFTDAKKAIEERVATQISGARANITLASMRSIQVFVLGEAVNPGPRTVPALATISSALMGSGGIKPIGSLRNIQLRRGGSIIARLDLYDLLVRGDASRDQRLLAGDVIFIPPVGSLIGVAGAVKRPGIYELSATGDRVKDVIDLAGGFDANADRTQSVLNRIGSDARRESLAVNLSQSESLSTRVRDGDLLQVEFNLPVVVGQVQLLGHLHRPGKRAVSADSRLTDLLASTDELKENADPGYVFIAREDRVSGGRLALSADLRAAWKDPNSASNVRLMSGDQLVVFEADRPRDQMIHCVMRPKAASRSRSETPETATSPTSDRRIVGEDNVVSAVSGEVPSSDHANEIDSCFEEAPAALVGSGKAAPASVVPPRYPTVNVSGALRAPGLYPFETNMRVSDLIRAGGGVSDRAFTLKAELIRYVVTSDQRRQREVLIVDLQKALSGDEQADAVVLPYDELSVRTIPEWTVRSTVTLDGEVVFPGTYSIAPGETLRGVLERAGGLKVTAFVPGAFFSRNSLRERELQQLQKLQAELRRDVATQQRALVTSERSGESEQLTALLNASLATAEENPALGRLSIDLDKVLRGGLYSRDDVLLQDGDRLFVPQRSDEITVIGEVFAQGSHIYQRGLTVADYLDFAGGLRSGANQRGIYVMSASGRARPLSRGWLPSTSSPRVQPGDTIIVPVEIPKLRDPLLATVGEVTQILYNLSLGAAAIRSFRN